MRRKIGFDIFILFFLFFGSINLAQEKSSPSSLTIDFIMRDPKWIGTLPGRPFWSEDGKQIYFMWNPENAESDSLYVLSRTGGTPRKLTRKERQKLPARYGDYNLQRTEKVYVKNGDLFILNIRKMQEFQITKTNDLEADPRFSKDGKKIIFTRNNNLYMWYRIDGRIVQLTDFRKGEKKKPKPKFQTEQEKWLHQQELQLMQVLKKRKEQTERRKKRSEKETPRKRKTIYLGNKRVQNLLLSPDEKYVTFVLVSSPRQVKRTIVPNYITESGFTTDIPSRTKVGSPQSTYEFGIFDVVQDTVYYARTDDIPGIFEQPAYLKKYSEEKKQLRGKKGKSTPHSNSKKEEKYKRNLLFQGPYWSGDGKNAVVIAYARDNKDRWILSLDIKTGVLKNLDRQHDEAWIGGPGIRGWRFSRNVGWMPDNRRFWFQSEASGYSHLYTVDIITGEKEQLTRGNFEVFNPRISRDHKFWYFTSSEVHPGERHFYRMPLNGGKRVRLTRLAGNNQVILSPDEKMLAVRYSYSNKPWRLYLMVNKPGSRPLQVISHLSQEFRSYPWRDPEIVRFTARDSVRVYARLYRPEHPSPRGPAVIFVHGAGYLQNAHKWWSSYFREYMFHNLLADHGYTVLDIDYRGSAGYGRNWRTAIYRHMGGKDLTDQVDGAKFLVEHYQIDPKRIGIYGGSYGGFITLMAMFTTPDVFACGAALRPVTDWAHYNHPYTANILNLPYADSLAYVQSSPIYFANGLKGALLICHGMVDTNVHFQDVVRLTQRLIELGKENWELAVYPMESHGFREPSSWTDEYKRIFHLFEENLK